MKKPCATGVLGKWLLALVLAGYSLGCLGAEPVVKRSAEGWVKHSGAATAPAIQALGPRQGPVHYQQTAAQAPLPPDLLAGFQREPVSAVKGRLPLGVGRVFEPAIVVSRDTSRAEDWTVLTNGWRVWSVEVASPGALGMRLHLEALALPRGARIVVYDPAKPERVVLAATGGKLPPERETWVQSVFAEKAVLECQVPPEADIQAVNFALTGLAHFYRLPRMTTKDAAGPCQVDVTCYPAWAQTAAGVAEISFIDGGTPYLCTGCLLSNGNTNLVNEYFLTAHHCIPNATVASTLEVYWFYQTETCNGTPPDINSVPVTSGGADMLATSTTSDFAFLQLRESTPDGVYYLGWSREAPSFNDTLTCIQHPHGDYKRISFGKESNLEPGFWWVQWTNGVTEPGSSGSPLLNPRQQVIGQLWGGSSACDTPDGPDRFGRFDVTYNAIRGWIDPVSELHGTYNGLFLPTNTAPFSGAGAVTLTLTINGKFTGKLQAGATRYSMSGTFSLSGDAQVVATSGKFNGATVTLHLDVTGASERITGTITTANWTAALAADRAVSSGGVRQGTYTLVVPGNYGSTAQPAGDSYASVTVDNTGHLRMSGLLADGTKVTQSTMVSKAGQWPLYVPLYSNAGYWLSWASISNSDAGELSGDLAWVKPPGKTLYYPNGFKMETTLVGGRYTRPAAGQAVLNAVDAMLVLTGGNLAEGMTNSVALNGQKAVSNPTTKLRLSFTPATGLFRGSVVGGTPPKPLQFSGAVLANQNLGSGCFLSGGQSGRVVLEPAP